MRDYGRRFMEVNNPNVWTNMEAYEEGLRVLGKAESEFENETFSIPYTPFMEPEDIIQTDRGTYIVDSTEIQVKPNKIEMRVNARAYNYG